MLGDDRFVRFGRRSAAALSVVLVLLAGLALLGWTGREPPSPGWRPGGFDAAFMRQLTHHHDLGVQMAELAAQRGDLEELRMLGRLMVAEQRAESRILRGWWGSWAGGTLPHPSAGSWPPCRACRPQVPCRSWPGGTAAASGPASSP